MEQEKKDQEEIDTILDSMELNWEDRKAKERELLEKKRRRPSEIEDGRKIKRMRRITHALLEEDWGEGGVGDGGSKRPREEDDEGSVDSSNNGGCTKRQRLASRRTKSTTIAEYFKSTSNHTGRMENWLGTKEDQDDFADMSDRFLATCTPTPLLGVAKEQEQKDTTISSSLQGNKKEQEQANVLEYAKDDWMGNSSDEEYINDWMDQLPVVPKGRSDQLPTQKSTGEQGNIAEKEQEEEEEEDWLGVFGELSGIFPDLATPRRVGVQGKEDL